jgi:hypothetical protein
LRRLISAARLTRWAWPEQSAIPLTFKPGLQFSQGCKPGGFAMTSCKNKGCNEDKRRAALADALNTNELYQQLADQLAGLAREQEFTAAKLERLRGEFSLYKLERRAAIAAAEAVA